jgi:signal transduction histidine kinase
MRPARGAAPHLGEAGHGSPGRRCGAAAAPLHTGRFRAIPRPRRVAYLDGVGTARAAPVPGAALRRLRDALGIRWFDVAAAAAVAAVVELNVVVGGGSGAAPLDALAYLLGVVMAVPVLFRRRWPLGVLIACSVLLFVSYILHRRNISPAPLLSLPLYDAALAGSLAAAIAIPAVYMAVGLFVVEISTHEGLAVLAADFLPSVVVLGLAIWLGDAIRSRRALAAETADRLRLAREEHAADAARRVAEERLRIARDLHDTVAHSMATITVQAGSALHLLGSRDAGPDSGDENLRAALTAIRETSKAALGEMRTTLGQLRRDSPEEPAGMQSAGLHRLPALCDAVTAAGAPVMVRVEGEEQPLPAPVDQAAYRILQESLTNVLRHAGTDARATVCLRYEPGALAIRVTDDGTGPAPAEHGVPADHPGNGHGLTGMAERAAAIGGEVRAGARSEGGFEVLARLPIAVAGAGG